MDFHMPYKGWKRVFYILGLSGFVVPVFWLIVLFVKQSRHWEDDSWKPSISEAMLGWGVFFAVVLVWVILENVST